MTEEAIGKRVPLWLIPNGTVFFSSACIMIVELVAGKLIARHVGMSLYTWTSIIGVIMAGISIGNFIGGKLADRYKTIPTLAVLFFLAAIACLSVLPLNGWSGLFSPFLSVSWPLRVFIHVAIVFFAPAMVLGAITPVVAKMALDFKRAQGRTLGGVFAWGVAGSLVGTFAAGFYLVMIWSVGVIIAVSGLGLSILGGLYLYAALRCQSTLTTSNTHEAPRDNAYGDLWNAISAWGPAAMTVFISNAAFMAFELALMRIVAREFGGSLYTWTTVIGVVLAGISLGNYCGGRLADRWPSKTLIAFIFVLSALAVALSPALHAGMAQWRNQWWHLASLSWPAQTLIHVSSVGFVPCVFIGMVSPVVTRRLLAQGNAPGASVGVVYAWGSVGAIAGTFITGYAIIQWIGSIPTAVAVAVLLALTAVIYMPTRLWTIGATCLCCTALLMSLFPLPALASISAHLGYRSHADPRVIYTDESQYAYIAVMEAPENPSVREMYLDRLVHTQIDMRDHTRLLYEYEWVYSAVMEKRTPLPLPVRAFVIGGGGYAYPLYLELMRPDSEIIVAEIDAAVTEAAHAAMGLPRDTSITIHHLDARNVVTDMVRNLRENEAFERFDFIFGDSINDYTVPFHLTTLEFKQAVHDLLKDDGIYLFNMIDMYDSGAFLSAVVNTCRQVFPQVAVFNSGRPTFIRDTFVVVCSRQENPIEDVSPLLRGQYGYMGEQITKERLDALIARNNMPLLSDSFAPVENLLAPVVRARAGQAGELHLAFAVRYMAQGRLDRALHHCRAAIDIQPQWPQAHETMAKILTQKDDVNGAIEALAAAIPGNPDPAGAWRNLASALTDAGRIEEAINAWRERLRITPSDVVALYNVGVLYGQNNQLQDAINAWQRALAINPEHADSLHNLAVAYLMEGNIVEARKTVDTMLSLGHNVDAEVIKALQTPS